MKRLKIKVLKVLRDASFQNLLGANLLFFDDGLFHSNDDFTYVQHMYTIQQCLLQKL